MDPANIPIQAFPTKPIRIGLTCWRWQRRRTRAIETLAERLGVTLHLTETIHGLHRKIEAQVSGGNVDQFLGEFARHC